jgi:hypothetical protein
MTQKEDYYGLVNYRGRVKYYHITASEDGRVRIEYIDYNPNREWKGVWVNNFNERLIEKFEKGSLEYEYFNSLTSKWHSLLTDLMLKAKERAVDKKLPEIFYWNDIGTSATKQAYKKAYKSIEKPEHINL